MGYSLILTPSAQYVKEGEQKENYQEKVSIFKGKIGEG